jgi:surface polysaccharide O-acyltransferase-like enzyme
MILFCSYALFEIFDKIKLSNDKAKNFITKLSYSSYCMYLFHRPVYIFLKKMYFPFDSLSQLFYLLFFCVPFIILLSYIIQYSYDYFVYELG